jgi:autotransporter-associated beta strand protein
VPYTIQGSGQINALSGLTKVGAAAVTLNVPGVYSSSTVVSNSTINLGASQTFANLSGNGAVMASTGSPTVTVNNSLNTTFAGTISGGLGLTKTGNSTLTLSGTNVFSGNFFVKAGGVTLSSGYMGLTPYASIGLSGTDTGTLTLKGTATVAAANDLNIGDVGSSTGTLNVQDNASLTIGSFFIGSANAAGSTASGTVNQTGGTVTQQITGAGTFCIGGRVQTNSLNGVGVYNLSGGTLIAASGIRVGSAGPGTFNQSGGTVYANGDLNIARFTPSVGTYNLDGGTLVAPRVTSSTSANATFNFNGGVLVPTGDNTGFISALSQINVRNGGAVIDSSNYNVTITQPLAHSSLGGDNAIDGGLTKRGNGTLTLTGTGSSYTGPTVVTGGTLSLATGSVGNLNNVTLNNGGLGLTLNYGSGTFSATSLSLAGNSALTINYDLLLGSPAVALAIGGGISASGLTVINVNGYDFTVGQFPLITYTGTPLANLNNFALGTLPVGVAASLVNNPANNSIDLMVTSVTSSSWIPLSNSDALGTSSFNTGNNWLDFSAPSAGNGYFTRAFTLRSPADSNPYTFGGNALSIDAGGQLLLKGTDGQVITVPNLILNGGWVVFGVSVSDNFTETLAGAVTLQPNTTTTVAANGSAGAAETLNVTAPVSGSGGVQINGLSGDIGVIVLAANNTYTGNTTVASGTLLVNGAVANTPVTVNANATLGGTGTLGGPVTVAAGGTLAPGIPARGALTAAIGTLTAGTTTLNGTMQVKIDRGAVPTSDKLVAPAIVINPGSTLTVTNLGATNLVAGDTFTLFSTPVSGAFGTVTLPALPDNTVAWTNRLAIDGTIAVVAASTINTNSPYLTNAVAGGNLTLSWPADHTGWTLQMQTNALGKGLGTNWVDVPGSASTNRVILPITTTNGATFYRLKY